jgi:energy-coupling factor transporter ATP-binding protein EcfA2
MLQRVQALNYRCLRSIDQRLGHFHALVGPNASGKSTFLDVIAFLGDLLTARGEIEKVVAERVPNFADLTWNREGGRFELAVEASIPEKIRRLLPEERQRYDSVRYELAVGVDAVSGTVGIDGETLWFVSSKAEAEQPELFPSPRPPLPTLQQGSGASRKAIIKKVPGGNDNYYAEATGYNPSFKLGRSRSALANLPADEASFPVSWWFRGLLEGGVQLLALNSRMPYFGVRFRTDGSNLPWSVENLRIEDPAAFERWLEHVRTGLPEIAGIRTVERPEDKHRYLMIKYCSGVEIPSWTASDGTLRLLGLTLPAYLPGFEGMLLVEEPENGIHPKAMQTVFQSLSSVYDAQVLMATHSPVVLGLVEPEQILCFAKDALGATATVSGHKHPSLVSWKRGHPDLGVIFASGILG